MRPAPFPGEPIDHSRPINLGSRAATRVTLAALCTLAALSADTTAIDLDLAVDQTSPACYEDTANR